MKKYIEPEVRVIETEMTEMLAASANLPGGTNMEVVEEEADDF